MFARSSGGLCSGGNGRKTLRASLTYTSGVLIGGGICLQLASFKLSESWNSIWLIPLILGLIGGVLLQICDLSVLGSRDEDSFYDEDDEGRLILQRIMLLGSFFSIILALVISVILTIFSGAKAGAGGVKVESFWNAKWMLVFGNLACAVGFVMIKFWRFFGRQDRED